MKREFIETNIFRALWLKSGLGEIELKTLQSQLLERPDAGDVIPGTHGLRKIRVAASGRGKRGGGRVFYRDFVMANKIFFIFLILKGNSSDLSADQKRQVAAMLKDIEKELSNGKK
jgi:hypothetical protein